MLAVHLLVGEFAINPQLATALRANHVITPNRELGHALNLLQRHELRNFDAIRFQISIEQGSACAAMDQLFGHFLATCGAGSTGPRRHLHFLILFKFV
jgi:hypothetical protein